MKTATSRNGAQKDVHQIINDKIIEQLQKGIVPWRVAWTEAGIPTNVSSQKQYRGINLMLLASLGYEQNFFITENQLNDIGATIKPNERPHVVTYWSNKSQEMNAEVDNGKRKTSALRYYMVYNVSQCAGILGELVPEKLPLPVSDELREKLVADIQNGPVIKHKDPMPYYDPLEDCLNMPKPKTFDHSAGYYRTLLHQLVHSTGHHTRLDRMGLVQMSEFGADAYSQEELVAEIGAGFLESYTGVASTGEPAPEYLQGWISKLQKDTHFIFTAAALAQKAVDFILNYKAEEETTNEEVEELAVV